MGTWPPTKLQTGQMVDDDFLNDNRTLTNKNYDDLTDFLEKHLDTVDYDYWIGLEEDDLERF